MTGTGLRVYWTLVTTSACVLSTYKEKKFAVKLPAVTHVLDACGFAHRGPEACARRPSCPVTRVSGRTPDIKQRVALKGRSRQRRRHHPLCLGSVT